MSQEFNFDIDKIANNAISKSDKTTEIIEANTTQENGQLTFLEKLTPEQQSAITWITSYQTKMPCWTLANLL